ncbi:hypothetical protein KJ780_04850 [Candidatus Micrarchaeota archaeon]|nr:hypothetical protein [Candidatus Micrarchaeota archaeon]
MDKRLIEVFLVLCFMFCSAQILGIYTGAFILEDAQNNELIAQTMQFPGMAGDSSDAFLVLLYVLAGALFFYFLIRFYKGDILFLIIEIGAVSFASSIVFYSFLRPFIQDTLLAIISAIFFGIIFSLLKFALPFLKNAVAVVAAAGVGAVFGFSLSFETAILLMILLAVYDYIAVFKTKHMHQFAESISKKQMPFVVSSKKMTEKGPIIMEIGTGDIIIPIMLEVSGLSISPICSATVFIASSLSLFALFILTTRMRIMLPALPIIAGFNIAFLVPAKLLALF